MFTNIQRSMSCNEHRFVHLDNDTANQREDHHWSVPRGKNCLVLCTNWNGNPSGCIKDSSRITLVLHNATGSNAFVQQCNILSLLMEQIIKLNEYNFPDLGVNSTGLKLTCFVLSQNVPLAKFKVYIDQESISISQSNLIILALIHSTNNIHLVVFIKITNSNLWIPLHAEWFKFHSWIH